MPVSESRPAAAMLILDIADAFARDRGMNGRRPGPLGKVKLYLVAQTDPATQTAVPLANPVEMQVIPNGSGFLVFFGKVLTADGATYRVDADRWPWTIRVTGDYYQATDVRPAAVPESFAPAVGGAGASAPIQVDLLPGATYPFPQDPPAQAAIILRGTLHNPDGSGLAGVRVAALNAQGQPGPNPALTATDGQWVMTFPQLPAGGNVTIRFTFPDGSKTDVGPVRLVAGRDNNLPQTALRGQVRLKNQGVAGAVVGADNTAGRTVTNSDGNWFLYFGMAQAEANVKVTATLADQSASKTSAAMLQPRATVTVPSFDF